VTNPHDPPQHPDAGALGSPGDPAPPTEPAQIPTPAPPPPTGAPSTAAAPVASSISEGTKLRRLRLRDPLSIVLIIVIVVAFTAAGVLGAELYARHVADTRIAAATECVVQDKASVSFGASPFLLQRKTSHYGPIVITTAGNQIRRAKGMKAQVKIDDVRLDGAGDSKGTIGALDATITWPADGIRQTVQNAIPLFGSFLSGVKTNPSNGTIELQGGLGSITAKPQVVNNAITLHVVQLTGLGFTLPSESVQPALDVFTNELANNFPLGIHPDSVQVTETGVTGHFSTRNATIPQGNQDPCFANL
jgi:LmeA-like phospholipid-binding